MASSTFRALSVDLMEGQSSTRNYIKNGDARSGVAGWSLYADAAGARPVDGTGGSPSITWARTTTNSLSLDGSFQLSKAAADEQGEGVSYDFTIDRADQAKVLEVSFDYEYVSGTYSNGTSSTDSDLIVYLFDVTNSRLMEPNQFKVDAVVSGQKSKFKTTFQTQGDSQSYRLILHVATTSASAYVINFDRFKIVQQAVVYNSATTDLQAYTPSGGWSTNATYSGYWRRVGDTLEVRFQVSLSGAPTGNLNAITLPTGLVIDTTKLNVSSPGIDNTCFGLVAIEDNGTERYLGYVAYQSTTTVQMLVNNSAGTYDVGRSINATTPFTFGASDKVTATFYVPILGWSSNTLSSNDADQRVLAARLTKTGNQTIATATQTLVTWDAKSYDTHGAFDLSTERFTAPQAGYYRVHARISYTAAVVAVSAITLRKNGVAVSTMFRSDAVDGQYVAGSDTIQLVAGDYLELYVNQNTGSNRDIDGTAAGFTYLDIERVQGPSSITSTELIAAQYTVTADITSANTSSPFIFTTSTYDTHSAYSTSTGAYTAPAKGLYRFTLLARLTSGSGDIKYYKSGSVQFNVGFLSTNQGAYTWTVSLNAGETVDIRTASASITLNFADATTKPVLFVDRIGV